MLKLNKMHWQPYACMRIVFPSNHETFTSVVQRERDTDLRANRGRDDRPLLMNLFQLKLPHFMYFGLVYVYYISIWFSYLYFEVFAIVIVCFDWTFVFLTFNFLLFILDLEFSKSIKADGGGVLIIVRKNLSVVVRVE